MHHYRFHWLLVAAILFSPAVARAADPQTVVGSQRLELEGDIASQMIAGIDKFLLAELSTSVQGRQRYWRRDYTSDERYTQSVERNRDDLRTMLGIDAARAPTTRMQAVGPALHPAPLGRSNHFEVYAVRWPAFKGVWGEGLLLIPTGVSPVADVVAIPDADQHPEQIAGLIDGVPTASQFARQLAANGCRVLVPTLISRERGARSPPGKDGRATLTNREYLYRPAFELGRHLIGYEVEKVRAGIDWFIQSSKDETRPIGVVGYGEGGLVAFYAGALDSRIQVTCVSGYFGSRQSIWREPIDRNIFGLLEQFGDAEIASMIAPRGLIVEGSTGPELEIPGEGGAPAVLSRQSPELVRGEWQRLVKMVRDVPRLRTDRADELAHFHLDLGAQGVFCRAATRKWFLAELCGVEMLAEDNQAIDILTDEFALADRQQRQVAEIDEYNQQLLRESSYVRAAFMEELDTTSLASYSKTVEPYRAYFRDRVVGTFDRQRLPARPQSRLTYNEPSWLGYEVFLDVFPNVFAYGILCVPKDIAADERRPVVVCQHGLEGRPEDVVAGDHRAYHDFAAKLAERGFVTFAPQNIYIFRDRFRTLQRKANPLRKTLFSIMVPQHQQIVDWLQTLPYVDPQRIAFYGLSYGGKSAMRIPPLVPDYCLSICSADFNDWVRKCASNRSPYSYVWTGEYEIFEWDLGSTFNYAEMAALIAPRPFMVERGQFDGVAPDEWVAAEFAKVRHLYQAKLGIGDRAQIEWFAGPHTINGQGTFEFLHKHLKWPQRQ